MTLSRKEKKTLYAFGCPSRNHTVTRLKWLSVRLVPPYSEERKAAASAYAREQGFQVLTPGKKTA